MFIDALKSFIDSFLIGTTSQVPFVSSFIWKELEMSLY